MTDITQKSNLKTRPDNTSIRADTKRLLKMRAAYHGMSSVEYLEKILRHHFEQSERINEYEQQLLEGRPNETE